MSRTITIRHQIGFHSDFPVTEQQKRPLSIGILQPGAVVPVVQEVEGYEFEKELTFSDSNGIVKKFTVKSNIWYQDKNGWWYWNGATKTLEEAEGDTDSSDNPIPGPTPDPVTPVIPTPPIETPETTFDWREKLKGNVIPSSWWDHSGKGLNIAILDAGFDMRCSAFQHMKSNIKTYDLRKDTYHLLSNIQNEDFVQQLDGKDKLPINGHGTSCLGVLGAKHPQKEIMGLVPDANFHLFNVYEHHIGPFNTVIIKRSKELMEKAFWLISNLDIDIVSISVNYPNDVVISDEIISQMTQTNTLWFWALKSMTNPTLDKYILDPPFPTPFFPRQTIGTLKKNQLSFPNNLVVTDLEQDKINFIIQNSSISLLKGKDKIQHDIPLECSFATPALAGLAALKLNQKKTDDPNFIMNPKTFIPELKKEATRFYKNYIPDDDDYTFLRLFDNQIA